MQLRPAGSFCGSGHLRDLSMLIALDVVQHEHGTRAGWQRGDRALEIDRVADGSGADVRAEHAVIGRVPAVGGRVLSALGLLFFSHLKLLTPLLAANVAEHEVHREPIDPARKRRLSAPRAESLPDMNEDVLRQLGGALSRAAHSETQREHATA